MTSRTRVRLPTSLRNLIASLLPHSRRGRFALGLVAAINIVLGTAYLWSYGGQTTIVRFEVRGNDLVVFVVPEP